MAKMVAKANAARKKMSELKVAGQSGVVSATLNGLYTFKSEIDRAALKAKLKYDPQYEDVVSKVVDQVCEVLQKDYDNAHEDTRKELEKSMMSSTSIDELRDMIS